MRNTKKKLILLLGLVIFSSLPCTCPSALDGRDVITLASGQNTPNDVSVDDNYVYFPEQYGYTIKKVLKYGGPVTVLASGLYEPIYVDIDYNYVYFVDHSPPNHDYIRKVSKMGGTVVTLADDIMSVHDFCVGSDFVYFVDYSGGYVKKVSKEGGTVVTLVSGLNNPKGICVDSNYVYFAEYYGGSIKKVPTTGGSVTTLASGLSMPYRVAVDSNYVYFTEYGGGYVKKVSKGGGTVVTLASGPTLRFTDITIDSDYVYFNAGDGNIKMVPKIGGSVETLASGQSAPSGLVVDWNYLYFAEYGAGNIKKIPLDVVSVSISNPSDGSIVTSNIIISADAYSIMGYSITSMDYQIDSGGWVPMTVVDNTGSATWDTTSVPNGEHTITVRATDSKGVNGFDSVTVTVDNPVLGDFIVDSVEPIQVIKDAKALIANKAAVVRVNITSTFADRQWVNISIVYDFGNKLYKETGPYGNGTPIDYGKNWVYIPGGPAKPAHPGTEDWEFNGFLKWTTQGMDTGIRAIIDSDEKIPESNENNNEKTAGNTEIVESKRLSILFVPVRFPDDPEFNWEILTTRLADWLEFMRGTYPVADVSAYMPWPPKEGPQLPLIPTSRWLYLAVVGGYVELAKAWGYDRVVVLVHDLDRFYPDLFGRITLGEAIGMGCIPEDRVPIVIDPDRFTDEWAVAHEVGHTYYLSHPWDFGPDINNAQRFWVAKRDYERTLTTFMRYDFGQDVWIDKGRYDSDPRHGSWYLIFYRTVWNLFDQLKQDDPEIILLSGLICDNGTVLADKPWYRLSSGTSDLSPEEIGNYSVVLLDNQQQILEQFHFNVSFTYVVDDMGNLTIEETNIVPFVFNIPYANGTSIVQIRNASNNVLLSKSISPSSPTVNITFPNGGEILKSGNNYTITWQGSDFDGDNLAYTLAYSEDGGENWVPLAIDLNQTSFVWDTSYLQIGSNYLVKVVATDGVNAGEDVSDSTFTFTDSTLVSGYISENTTWTLSNSPYAVIGDVIVEPGVFLIIEPGVVVKFTNGTNLVIDGGLIAQGNVANKIRFTSIATEPQFSDWGGILFRDSSVDNASVVNWIVVKYADTGISITSCSQRILNSEFENNNIGIAEEEGSLFVYNSTISNCQKGIEGHTVYVESSIIRDNEDSGIFIPYYYFGQSARGRIISSSVYNNTIGIFCAGALLLTSCTVVNNRAGGIWFTDSTPNWVQPPLIVSIWNSNISGNNGYGIKYRPNNPVDKLVSIRNSIIENNNGSGLIFESISGSVWPPYLEMLDSIVRRNQGNGLEAWLRGENLVSNVTFSNNDGNGLVASAVAPHGTVMEINNSAFVENVVNGISMSSWDNIAVDDCLISKNGRKGISIFCDEPDSVFQITDCSIIQNGECGIEATGEGRVHYSNLHDNSLLALKVTNSRNINATYNWWGTTNETLIKGHIYDYYDDYNLGKVFYKPYLVHALINVPRDYPTIQEAINAANEGDTIFVSSGTYYERVIVNKTVSLIGENKRTTTIIANPGWPSPGTTVVSISSNNVTFTDFTVQGEATRGIGLGASYCLISNNIVGGSYQYADILLMYSSYNTIVNNHLMSYTATGDGIRLGYDSNYNTVVGNNLTGAIYLIGSYANRIFHNNLPYAYSSLLYNLSNIWDNGYPSGGNYWSDYTGVDEFSGPDQDQLGSDGIGDIPYTIDGNNIDRYPLMKPYGVQHDIGITNITTSKTIIGQGYSLHINIRIVNYGVNAENFNVTVYANTTIIAILTNITLTSRNFTTMTFTWNTTGVPCGNYTISANATILQGETDTADNTYTEGTITVTIPGDINGDKVVDSADQDILDMAWGSIIGEPDYIPEADLNGDGVVDSTDYGILGANWGHSWS